ncbi:MAG TPA: GlsB/YeaQ/YmgE family stress response membrane protein [Chthoniobacterales bacterium]|nr:GlsB/YeaQ/YmgE family stress response membrane protein [Chthoniobacterales bacterium]
MLSLLGTLLIGLIVGAIAKLIVPGKEPGGCLITIAIGIAGSFVAFYLGGLLGWTSGHPDSLRPVGFIPSLLGAIILLLIYHWIRRRTGH